MKPVSVYIGYDGRQPIAFQVAAHSVWKHAKNPVCITRLDLTQLPMKRAGLTSFTYSRFLVPYLSDFEGVSIFLDSDVLVRGDVTELLAYPLMDPTVTCFVVQGSRKFEWPSVMVFQNVHCKILTPAYVDDPRNPLFGFGWADHHIAALPKGWNHLVGYDAPNPDAKLVHFTAGLPVWAETERCEYAEEWHAMLKESMATCSFQELMGKSVHVQHMKKVGV